MQLQYVYQPESDFEIVERKGLGHPDTLADDLAEELSRVYANYTKERFGAVLHHNFDKVGLMGGETKLEFGKYRFMSPIRVLINGRASYQFGGEEIPLRELIETTTKNFLKNRLYGIDTDKDIRILYEVTTGSSPGSVGQESNLRNHWFAPKSLDDLSELKHLNCNDTSLGAAFYHRSIVENCVWIIEHELNSIEFHNSHPWLGVDIKIMGCRCRNELRFTMAIPQLASMINSTDQYMKNKEYLYIYIEERLQKLAPNYKISLDINTRDRIGNSTDLYLTATGSSIEMGDEGFVGRGNRMGGLITPFRPYTMEGICGKNPVYHTGKMYSIASWEISKVLYEMLGIDVSVMLVGQSGQALSKPWNVVLSGDKDNINTTEVTANVTRVLQNFNAITERILAGEYPLC